MPINPYLSMFTHPHPVIGMVHLQALPGSPNFAGDLQAVICSAVADAKALIEGGVDGLMIENFFDIPFFKSQVGPETVSAMTCAAIAVREALPDIPLGINVLRNDGQSALAIAVTVGAAFVRVNVLSGAMLTDQGIIEGQAAELLRYRQQIRATQVQVWADVRVKHAAPLVVRPLNEEVEELTQRAGAGAIIVSGSGTGHPTAPRDAGAVKAAAGGCPVLIGSGVSVDDLEQLWPVCDGLIVGSSLKTGGNLTASVDPQRVVTLMDQVNQLR